MIDDVVICVRTKRPPPVQTFLNYPVPRGMKVILVVHPDNTLLAAHHAAAKDEHVTGLMGIAPGNLRVVLGERGLGAQAAVCYEEAAKAGFPYFFRLDDDLQPMTFIRKDGNFPGLTEVITEARKCIDETNTSLVGFSNTSNCYWMGEGYKRTYGLVHGGANLSVSSLDPVPRFMDRRLVRAEDVYRTCAHRVDDLERGGDGMVGRVAFIGFDKRGSTVTAGQTSVSATPEEVQWSHEIVLKNFPNMVSCTGTRWINGGKDEIANWRMKRSKTR
jgi:hypothetical protein